MAISAAHHTTLQRDDLPPDARRVAICDHCRSQFQPILPGCCEKCGLPATVDPEFPKETAYGADCQQHRFGFDLARS